MKTHAQTSAALLLATALGAANAQEPLEPVPTPPTPPSADHASRTPRQPVLSPAVPAVPKPLPGSALEEVIPSLPVAQPNIPTQPTIIGDPVPAKTEFPPGTSGTGLNATPAGLPDLPHPSMTSAEPVVTSRPVPISALRTGQDIIRETKLKILQRHYEASFNQSIEMEKAALMASPEEQESMTSRAMAMREFVAKLENEIRDLTLPASANTKYSRIGADIRTVPVKKRIEGHDDNLDLEPERPAIFGGGGVAPERENANAFGSRNERKPLPHDEDEIPVPETPPSALGR